MRKWIPAPAKFAPALCAAMAMAAPLGAGAQNALPLITMGAAPKATAEAPAAAANRRSLTLADAIRLGMQNNLDVEVARYSPQIAAHEKRAAWAQFEPNFTANWRTGTTETPRVSTIRPEAFTRSKDGAVGFEGVLPKLGWRYSAGYTGGSIESTSQFAAALNPQYSANFAAETRMPLLRGFLWGREWVEVRRSGLRHETALQQFRAQLMDTIQQIEHAYWALAARGQQLALSKKSSETAAALLAQSRAQYDVGIVSKVAVIEAEAGHADRAFREIAAENAYQNAQDALANLVFAGELQPGARIKIATADDPNQYTQFQLDEAQSVARAFAERPALQIARRQIKQSELAAKFAFNQRLPQLDLVGSYGMQGIAGQQPPATDAPMLDPDLLGSPLNTVGDFAQVAPQLLPLFFAGGEEQRGPGDRRRFLNADDDFFGANKAKQWSGGLVLSLPLGNGAARAQHRIAKLQVRQNRTRAKRLEQRIILEVRDAVRNLRAALQRIRAAKRRVAAASEQLRAEELRLEHGESTPFLVLQREEILVEAESQQIAALQAYHASVAALERAQGTILEGRGVAVQKPPTTHHAWPW